METNYQKNPQTLNNSKETYKETINKKLSSFKFYLSNYLIISGSNITP